MPVSVPQVIEGIPCYAPELAFESPDFPGHSFATLYAVEESSFWFRARNRLIKRAVNRYIPDRPSRFLEIGCGTGYVLKGLSELPQLDLMGADIHLAGLRLARERVPQAEFA